MKVFTCTDHDGIWVGVASVVVARDEVEARGLLVGELADRKLDWHKPFTLHEVSTAEPKVIVLQDGDY